MDFQRKSFMYGVIVGSVTYAVMKWYCERRTRKKIRMKDISFDSWDRCLLFIPTEISAHHCSLTEPHCYKWFCPRYNYWYFLTLIEGTGFSLDICVYLITSNEVAEIIFRLLKRGVYVRIVMDKEMSQSRDSKLNFFIEKHIPVKLIEGKDGQIMHNKFIIIDHKKLVTGSFNWTESGFKKNFENGVVIHNKFILAKYIMYYESIWNPQKKFFS